MKIEKIKPTPKYILAAIEKLDKKLDIKPCGLVRYYAYLTKNDGELCKVTCAVKVYKGVWYCKQVAVYGLHSDKCFCRDIEYSYMGGYKVGFYAEGMRATNQPKWFEDGKWYECDDKYFNPYARLINPEYAYKIPEFKYSACEFYKGDDIIEYLRTYEKHPQAEMLVKLGFSSYIVLSKQILTKIGTDKAFRKWLYKNRNEINEKIYYVSSVLSSYKQGKSIAEVQAIESDKKYLARHYKTLYALVKGDYERYRNYIKKQNISNSLYEDYFNACQFLGLDMTDDKNRFPHDFKRWHDIRIDERATAKALKDEQERKELYAKFAEIALKYMPLQETSNGAYVVYIAQSPAELIREGDLLHHCVGKYGYDQKFCREQSLIFFVRSANDTETPLTTIEYDIKSKKIRQCYANGNTKPDQAVTDYVNNVWLPHANKALKKIAA